MVSKLQEKNRMYKKLAENAEEMATANLARLRRAQVSRTILGIIYYSAVLQVEAETEDKSEFSDSEIIFTD